MAREEHDREDLLREATALVERAELRFPHVREPVVIGFRRDGCGSIYLGAEPTWHFNTQNELRRAYIEGRLVKAERGRLVSLERRRAKGQVQLLRHELNDAETAALLASLQNAVAQLSNSLNEATFELVGQVPESSDVVTRIRRWLGSLPQPAHIASSPHSR
jgi:hypothetical protein